MPQGAKQARGWGARGKHLGVLAGGLEVVLAHPSREGSGTSCAEWAGEEQTRSALPLPMNNDGGSGDLTSTGMGQALHAAVPQSALNKARRGGLLRTDGKQSNAEVLSRPRDKEQEREYLAKLNLYKSASLDNM